MADNVKIPYVARENTKVGTHSFYPQPIAKGTFGFDRMCKKAAKNTTIEEHTIRSAVTEYMKVAQEALLEGNRVEIGEQFITLYPNLKGSVKDYKDQKTGETVVVTAKDLTASKCKSRVGATVNRYFSDEFERSVSWVKTDKTGAVIDEGEDATETNEEAAQGGGNNTQGGGSDEVEP
jgi:nucleoid DNA-binding protein